jgi:hypothetical protein
MAQAVSCWSLTVEAQVQSQASPDWICGAQSGIGTGISLSTVVFSCHCYSTNTPYWHPFLYHQQCIILAHDSAVKTKHFCLSLSFPSPENYSISVSDSTVCWKTESASLLPCHDQAVCFKAEDCLSVVGGLCSMKLGWLIWNCVQWQRHFGLLGCGGV